jgi:hypothetical protein
MNKITNTVLAALAIGLLGSGVLCEQAQAIPITGSIEFVGSATPSGASPGLITVHFNNPWHTLAGTGIYLTAGIPSLTPATFNDFSFTGDGSLAVLTGPDVPLWTFSFGGETYSFDLLALTNGHTEAGSMSFSGTGIAHASGVTAFDDTPATVALQGSGQNFTFSISTSTTTSTGVPDGGTTVGLLGIALVGIAILRRQLRLA